MKNNILFTLLMCFVLNTYGQKNEIRNAESAVENKNYSEAKSLLKEVEGAYTNESKKWQSIYLLTKGRAYLANRLGTSLEDLKIAAEAFQMAIDLGEDVDDAQAGFQEVRAALVNNAVEDQNTGKNLLASKKLYESYKLGTKDTLYLYYAAGSALNAQDYNMALQHYQKLLDLNFDGSQTLYQAKNVESDIVETFGNKILRDASIKSGSHIEPNDEVTPSKTGEIAKYISLIYLQQEKPEKAIESLQRAKEENPDDVSLLQAEADLYYNLDNIQKYNEIMSIIAEKNPNDPIVFYNLGVSAEKLKDYDKARAYYQKSIDIDPKMANAYNNIASIILSQDRVLTEEMNKLGTSEADTKKYDKLKAEKNKVLKEAIPYLQKTIELDPSNTNAMKYLKSIYYQIGENDRAQDIDKMIKEIEGN